MDMGPLAALKDSFDGFHYEVYEARWGSVFAALAALLPLEPLLRVVWDVDAFRDGRGVEERRDGATLDLGAADEAIRSDFFWAYAQMLDSIGELLGGICRWGEGCPCHPASPELRGLSRHARANQLEQEIGIRLCPLRSCMAPACAAGSLQTLLQRLLGQSNACLLLLPAMAPLSEAAKADVVGDFARARAH